MNTQKREASNSEVSIQLEELEAKNLKLGELVSILEERLSPILPDARKTPSDATSETPPLPESPLGQQLFRLNGSFDRTLEQLCELYASIKL